MGHGHFQKLKNAGPIGVVIGLSIGVLIASLFALLFGKLVQLLWNGTIADIFSLKEISYMQGVGLLFLSRILVGGMGHGHHGKGCHDNKREEKWECHGEEYLEEKALESETEA